MTEKEKILAELNNRVKHENKDPHDIYNQCRIVLLEKLIKWAEEELHPAKYYPSE